MLQKPEEVRVLTLELDVAMWSATSIIAFYDSGLAEQLREPRTVDEAAAGCRSLTRAQIERVLDVVATNGLVARDGERWSLAEGAKPYIDPGMRASLTGHLRGSLLQAAAFVDAARGSEPKTGWTHTSRDLLQAQGEASGMMGPMLKRMIAPQLDGLEARLEAPGARFLDVGTGVGMLAIAAARTFPQLSVVGLDGFDAPLAIARENVARASLENRVELRKTRVEDLSDAATYDVAWLPSFFVADCATAAKRIHDALKPGGWVILGTLSGGVNDRQRATMMLLLELWNGGRLLASDGEKILKDAGFTNVRILPGPAWAPAMVVGQRAP